GQQRKVGRDNGRDEETNDHHDAWHRQLFDLRGHGPRRRNQGSLHPGHRGGVSRVGAAIQKASGHKVTTVFTGTLDANKRLAAGETYDLLIMSLPSIEEHIKAGKVVPGSRVDLAKSGVGVVVKAGAPKPDISTTEALKKTVLAAKSIGYSTGPSGIYMIGVFQRMGIADEIKPKLK